jgi:hypothetical protein
MDSHQQPALDPGYQGPDVELHGQAKLDRGHLTPVYQDGDRWLLVGGDLVPDQVHQLGAAGRSQGAPGGAHQVMLEAPTGQQQGVQADIQQPGGRGRGLGYRCLPGGLRQPPQGVVQVGLG